MKLGCWHKYCKGQAALKHCEVLLVPGPCCSLCGPGCHVTRVGYKQRIMRRSKMDHQNIINYNLLLLQSFAVSRLHQNVWKDEYYYNFTQGMILSSLKRQIWSKSARPRLKPPHQVSSAWSSTPITFNPKPLSCVPTLVLHPDYCRCYSFLQLGVAFHLSWLELQTNHHKVFTIKENAPTSALTIKTILRHYAKWVLT